MQSSIRSRFIASLTSNVLRSGTSFATGLLLARWLGPQDYGRMVFLLASFVAFRQFLDLGSSTAFFTLLSRRKRSRRFVALYGAWVSLQLLASLALVCFILPDSLISRVWVGESRPILVLALLASFMQGTVWSIASQMAEASRETVRVQRLNALTTLINLGVMLALWGMGQLAIPLIFATTALEWALAGILAARMYRTSDAPAEPGRAAAGPDTVHTVSREFLAYCLPLIPYAWVSFAHDFLDRWMLQNWGGTAEQGYYGVAQQFAGIGLFATSAILSIFWKEIAEAHHDGDMGRVEWLYSRISRMLFFCGAAIAGGLLPWTSGIIEMSVGASYAGGSVTLMLMFLYPVHQSMGQIGNTMLYATGNVRAQVKLGVAFMMTSLAVAYVMMAPSDAWIPGLGMASRGLAWKMVLLQFAQVNVAAWLIARLFGWQYDWRHQFGALGTCLGLGWLVHLAATVAFAGVAPMPVQLVLGGACYVAAVLAAVFAWPWLIGFSRAEIAGFARRVSGATQIRSGE
ncbi:MAG: lipopolysaccharide biosynthesis protein [Ignavibacteria bacterium]